MQAIDSERTRYWTRRFPKTRAEFIVAGSAFPPGGVAVLQCGVRARVGTCEKILQVFGDRYWDGSTPSEPTPFVEMPIDWAHAYGGPRYPKNPLGKGHTAMDLEGRRIRMLPNVEHPRSMVETPRHRVEPAGFMPQDISWPQRARLAGTYDAHWRKHGFPGYARDIDWEIFNIAPPDQRSGPKWASGETYVFQNLHPQKPVIEGALPPLSVRAFVTRAETGPQLMTEVSRDLQTLWFFPDAERAILIFTGSTPVVEPDAEDLLTLLLAAEVEAQPRAEEHYARVLAERLDPQTAAIACLRERDLLPEDLAPGPEPEFADDRELSRTDGLLLQNLHRKALAEFSRSRALIESLGLDPDVHGPPMPVPPPPPPTPDDLPNLIAELRVQADERRAEAEVRAERSRREIDAVVDGLGIEGFDSKVLAAERNHTPVGPPTFTAFGQRATLARIAADSRRQGTIIEEIEQMIADDALYASWTDAEQKMRDAYRRTAHLQNPAPAMSTSMQEACRARVRQAIAAGERFSTLNLTGADLSGMDLAGQDLSGACLESARLDGADLRGADLRHAVLAHASLASVRLDDAKLVGANLGKTKLVRCVLAGADLTDAILAEAECVETCFERANLVRAELAKATFERVDARCIVGSGLVLIDGDFRGLNLAGAQMEGTTWLRVSLDGIDMSGARLSSSTFMGCSAKHTNFAGAELSDARFVDGCKLDGALLSDAALPRSNLRATSLEGCDLRRATFDDADLSGCNLRGARMHLAVARRAKFEKADLSDAELIAANLMEASFSGATIHGADLRGANLHGADMARVRTDDRVQVHGALLTKVVVDPRYDSPQRLES